MASRKIMLKVIVLGESGVGKTSLLLRYVSNKFTIATKSTIGTDFLTKQIDVNDKVVTLQIWDTAGQERFQGLGSAFFRGSDGVLFVFDVTRQETFAELERWKQTFLIQIGQEGNADFPIVIVANKADREEDRQVSVEEMESWAESQGVPIIETSAKSGQNVDEAFQKIAKVVIENMKPEEIHYDTVDIQVESKKKGGDCDC
uniref:Ras-related protein Rab-7b n=1 Tax=Paramoeba aestuarina TaxID=180227 RepID=A0A7S4KMQ1_9EUKA|mmetsp:Transcript_21443/g.33318  ORF Transcript_21443/g.33318 Transcript_21443/m.33318 type:complete len:202 (+) Transcript_21443:102-707(+)|eukprot:CAMPEP_0201517802 /NCGR_PEP_ID=MMETSP0161_2-20130828/8822_1 /ASSEMBLY_ACC=CAM_ASM_000251 /TAXON_ID=180227 /ORGANISM="Neoparamoeba aestuarina, Strain SoJaBio B1-5/56/2" /LENGTH=201 /DNA_ID=CAMNT_0047915417 /DNA_START=109 /DNA_END=714 /DNA_ORIENTATION=+